MTYKETIDYLYNAAPAFEKVGAGAYKEGLSTTMALDEHFGHPHRCFKSIHVAGTNGKGSTSHTLAAILQSAGYKVGLYTSPHLVDFRERIRVNGEMITEERVIKFVEEERNFFEPLHPSFFELTTALAFKYFEEQGVEIAVIEVGLGGRLDCTNIITPLLSIITNISFDHTQFLGDTLAKIAGEKAGIIKRGVPVVVGEYTEETKPVFEQKAKEMEAPICFAQDDEAFAEIGSALEKFELKGSYQAKNLRTILCAVKELRKQLTISDKAMEEGLANVCKMTGLMGRWQTLNGSNGSKGPLVICDTGHNLAGWEYLAVQLKELSLKVKDIRIVFGMVDDKDVDGVLELMPKEAKFYFCQASTHRAIPATRVQEKAKEKGLSGDTFPTVEEAYQKALMDASSEDAIFVGGSSYVVADLLTFCLS